MSPPGISSGSGSRSNGASSSSSSSTAVTKEVDGKALAIQLAGTLLELSLTLAASYYFSRWLAKKIQGDATAGMDGYTDEAVDGGSGGVGVIPRLKKLLAARHEATLLAMMVQQQTKNQYYAQLEQELIQQHEQSLSTLNSLSSYEMSIAQTNVIDPSNLSVRFSDIGGMDHIKSEIYDLVVLPLLRPDLFLSDSGLVSPPKGILLYGPPGTGKTMLAKAIAKESHATFVNVQLSTIMNKWFGESNKLISAVFGLARKLAPSVVFIDEMDAFLSQRDGTEGSAVNSMKSEFLTLWDGLLSERPKTSSAGSGDDSGDKKRGSWRTSRRSSSNNNNTLTDASPPMMLPTPPIIVLGATNRPYDVDPAILRRLPRSFEISLPNHKSRLQLLRLFLEKQHMTPEAKEFLPKVAEMTIGYSGSDLKEVCRAAAWEPVREMTSGASRKAVGWDGDGKSNNPMLKRTLSGFPPRGTKARPVNKNDFMLAVQKVKKTGESARDFHKKEFLRGRDEKMAMAADIRNTPVGGAGDGGNGKKNGKKATTIPQSAQPIQQIDIQELMRVAMAAAASMNNQGYVDESAAASEEEEDDDSPPEIFVDATG